MAKLLAGPPFKLALGLVEEDSSRGGTFFWLHSPLTPGGGRREGGAGSRGAGSHGAPRALVQPQRGDGKVGRGQPARRQKAAVLPLPSPDVHGIAKAAPKVCRCPSTEAQAAVLRLMKGANSAGFLWLPRRRAELQCSIPSTVTTL